MAPETLVLRGPDPRISRGFNEAGARWPRKLPRKVTQ